MNKDGGFAVISGLVIVFVVAAILAVGSYVYLSRHKSKAPVKTSTKPEVQPRYLTIKEWNIKMPLNSSIERAYYRLNNPSHSTNSALQYIDLFDAKIDATSNAAGESCKDDGFPLFVIIRARQSEADQITNPQSPAFDPEAGTFKTFSGVSGYQFAGVGFHQAAPRCLYLNGDTARPDTNIDKLYTADKQAFTDAFAHLQPL